MHTLRPVSYACFLGAQWVIPWKNSWHMLSCTWRNLIGKNRLVSHGFKTLFSLSIFAWFLFSLKLYTMEKEMANHSSILAWRIPWTGEPGGLRSMGLRRVRGEWKPSPCYVNRKDLANADEAGTCLYIFRMLTLNKLKLFWKDDKNILSIIGGTWIIGFWCLHQTFSKTKILLFS